MREAYLLARLGIGRDWELAARAASAMSGCWPGLMCCACYGCCLAAVCLPACAQHAARLQYDIFLI